MKIKYDADYISYIESGESAAVFIARDVAGEVPSAKKWIDVISSKGRKRNDGRWDFQYFDVELFERRKYPVYPKSTTDEDKKYITWQTAHEDIGVQRAKGVIGPKYRVYPRLVNKNRGKFHIERSLWNKTFNRWVPAEWKTDSCEWRKRKVYDKAEWVYEVKKVVKLDDSSDKVQRQVHNRQRNRAS